MKLNLLILIFLTISFNSSIYGQTRALMDDFEAEQGYNVTSYGILEDEYLNAEGSPYLNDEFVVGTIIKNNNVAKAYLRYNIFFEEIEVSKTQDGKNISVLEKNTDVKAVFNNVTYVFMLIGNGEESQGAYMQILSTGTTFDLYAKTNVRYIKPYLSTNGIKADKPGRFSQKTDFYLVSKRQRFIPIPKKKREFLKMVTFKKDEIEKYIKKNNLNFNDIKDVKQIVKFYNKTLTK